MPKNVQDKANAIWWRDFHEYAAKVFAWLIVVGLAVELADILHDSHSLSEAMRRMAGSFLIMIGVGGEIIFAGRSGKSAEALRHLTEIELSEADAKAREADARAKEAARDLEVERFLRLRLEAQVAPRRLTPEQQDALTAALGVLSGRRVRVKSYSLDVEAAVLAKMIIECFKQAGWSVDDNTLSQGALGVVITGVLVEGSMGAYQDGVANTVLSALRAAAGLDAVFGSVPQPAGVFQPDDGTMVHAIVFVGVKPIAPDSMSANTSNQTYSVL